MAGYRRVLPQGAMTGYHHFHRYHHKILLHGATIGTVLLPQDTITGYHHRIPSQGTYCHRVRSQGPSPGYPKFPCAEIEFNHLAFAFLARTPVRSLRLRCGNRIQSLGLCLFWRIAAPSFRTAAETRLVPSPVSIRYLVRRTQSPATCLLRRALP